MVKWWFYPAGGQGEERRGDMVDAGRSVEFAAVVAAAVAAAVAGRMGEVRRPVSVGVAMRSVDEGPMEKKKKKAEGGGEVRRQDRRGSVGVVMRSADEGAAVEKKKAAAAADGGGGGDDHPYDFLVCGPRNVSFPNWRDLFRSSWKDPNYKRVVIACFIQAAYLLEIDRQEKRTGDGALAPKWWKPFKYKLAQALVDERDGSIYGALFEWDLAAAISGLIVARPGGAPRAVLALRGTLLTSPTIRRDLEDDLQFLGWESLRGSTRYGGALAALKSAVEKHGDGNVWVGGHSLGAGFALQVGKALAKQGAFVECHLFNPPSISLTAAVRNIGDTAAMVWRRITSAPPVSGDAPSPSAELSRSWVPHLYVNQSDYICCLYTKFSRSNGDLGDDLGRTIIAEDPGGSAATRLFVASKGPKRFLEAHGLQQWWSDDIELQQALDHSRLINRQLRSLYTLPQPPPQPTPQTPGSI